MKKIPTLFTKDVGGRFCVPRFKVVLEPNTIALRKFDGTSMFLDRNGQWFYRRAFKENFPSTFIECTKDTFSGKSFGWMPVDSEYSFKSHFEDALSQEPYDLHLNPGSRDSVYEFGTYELIGQKINRNPENVDGHRLMPHRRAPQVSNVNGLDFGNMNPQDAYEALKTTLEYLPIEGVVFWEPYSVFNEDEEEEVRYKPVAKLRKKDFEY